MPATKAPSSTGRAPTAKELEVINRARRIAIDLARKTEQRLEPVVRSLLPGSDFRVVTPDPARTRTLFEKHFKSKSHSDAQEVREAFKYILGALEALTPASYRVVTDDVADADGKRDGGEDPKTLAYVFDREPTVYFAERFFFGHVPESTADKARAAAATGMVIREVYDMSRLARVLVHEVAHFKLGARHPAGRTLNIESGTCETGLPVRNFRDAVSEAYCFDLFAHCAGRDS